MNNPILSDSPPKMRADVPSRSPTLADVAMKIAHDGPAYALIALVGVMAMKGNASASEMVITGLGALLSRSWPRAVQLTGVGGAMVFFVARAVEPLALAAMGG